MGKMGKMGRTMGGGLRSGAKKMGQMANTGYQMAKNFPKSRDKKLAQVGRAIGGGMKNAARAGMNKARQLGGRIHYRVGKMKRSLGKRFG